MNHIDGILVRSTRTSYLLCECYHCRACLAKERICRSHHSVTAVVLGDDGVSTWREDEKLRDGSNRHPGFARALSVQFASVRRFHDLFLQKKENKKTQAPGFNPHPFCALNFRRLKVVSSTPGVGRRTPAVDVHR